jgi:hypothetical protein
MEEPGQQLGVKAMHVMWEEWAAAQTVRNSNAQSAQGLHLQQVKQCEQWRGLEGLSVMSMWDSIMVLVR